MRVNNLQDKTSFGISIKQFSQFSEAVVTSGANQESILGAVKKAYKIYKGYPGEVMLGPEIAFTTLETPFGKISHHGRFGTSITSKSVLQAIKEGVNKTKKVSKLGDFTAKLAKASGANISLDQIMEHEGPLEVNKIEQHYEEITRQLTEIAGFIKTFPAKTKKICFVNIKLQRFPNPTGSHLQVQIGAKGNLDCFRSKLFDPFINGALDKSSFEEAIREAESYKKEKEIERFKAAFDRIA